MAKKKKTKLNAKFLSIVGMSLVLLVGGAYATWKLVRKQTPEKLLRIAEEKKAEGEIDEWARFTAGAAVLKGTDPEMYVRAGDNYGTLTWRDRENVGNMLGFWNKALEVDPTYMPALERLLDAYATFAEKSQGSKSAIPNYKALGDLADRVLKVEPEHKRAKTAKAQAVLESWMSGVDQPETDRQEAQTTLEQLHAADPANSEAIFTLGRLYAHTAGDANRRNDGATAAKIIDSAADFLDEAVNKCDTPETKFRVAQCYIFLAAADVRTGNPERFIKRVREYLERAYEKLDPSDKLFAPISVALGQMREQSGDREAGEQLLRDAMAKRPDEVEIRLSLAELLGRAPGRRKDALELLASDKIEPKAGFVGLRGAETRDWEVRGILNRANLLLDEFAAADPQRRAELMKAAQTDLDKLKAVGSGDPRVMRLEGRVLLAQNKPVDAIQLLERARTAMGEGESIVKDDVNFMLARCYMLTRQTGQAKNLLLELIVRYPTNATARAMLAEALLREGSKELAKIHVTELEKVAPNLPLTLRLKLATMDAATEKEQMDEYFGRLPENNRDEMLEKIEVAVAIKKFDEAARMLTTLREKDPDAIELILLLARTYVAQEKREDAVKLLEEAMKKHPNEPALKLAMAQATDAGAEAIAEIQRESVEQMTDPFDKAMTLYSVAMRENKPEEAIKHLQDAERARPDQPRVLELLFNDAMSRRNWDVAASYLDKLVKVDGDRAGGLTYKIRYAIGRGELDQANDLAQQLTRARPEFFQSWLALAKVTQLQGRLEESAQHYILALQKQPQNVDALKGIIEVYYALNRPDQVRRYIDMGLAVRPALFKEDDLDFKVHYGNPEEAINERTNALNADPSNIQHWLNLGVAYLKAAQKRGQANDTPGMLNLTKRGREALLKGVQRWPTDERFVRLYADLALLDQSYDDAEKIIREYLAQPGVGDRAETQFVLPDFFLRAGKPDKMMAALDESLTKFPGNEDLLIRKATMLQMGGQIEQALQTLEPHLKVPVLRKQYIETLIAAGRYAEAESKLKEALPQVSSDAEEYGLRNLLSLVYITSARWPEAQQELDRVLRREPRQPAALYYRALMRSQQPRGDLNEAAKDLVAVIDQLPNNVEARALLADVQKRRRDFESAIREYEAILRVRDDRGIRLRLFDLYCTVQPPRWPQAERVLREAVSSPAELQKDPELLTAFANMWRLRKDLNRAVQIMDLAIKASPGNLALVRGKLGLMIEAKSFTDVLKETDAVLAAGKGAPAPAWVWIFRAKSQVGLGDTAAALKEYERGMEDAVKLNDDIGMGALVQGVAEDIDTPTALRMVGDRWQTEPRWTMVVAYLQQQAGKYAEAAEMIDMLDKKFDQLARNQQESLLRLTGQVFLSMTPPNVARAIEAYKKLMTIVPEDWAVLNNIAYLYTMPGPNQNFSEALKYSTRAYELTLGSGGGQPLVMDTHGYALVVNGRVDEGIALLKSVIDMDPFPEAHLHLAEALLIKNLPDEAMASIQACQDLVEQWTREKRRVDDKVPAKIEDLMNRAKAAQDARRG
jgi:tetratricopeptide (TPR) repeat protein